MEVIFSGPFKRQYNKIKDKGLQRRMHKAVMALKHLAKKGKPLKYGYKGRRSLKVKPFRIFYVIEKDHIEVTYFEHRDKAYK